MFIPLVINVVALSAILFHALAETAASVRLLRVVMFVLMVTSLAGNCLTLSGQPGIPSRHGPDAVGVPIVLEGHAHEGATDACAWRAGAIGIARSYIHLSSSGASPGRGLIATEEYDHDTEGLSPYLPPR